MPSSANVPIEWEIQTKLVVGMTLPIARLVVAILLPKDDSSQPHAPIRSWLDSGAPISVVPFSVQLRGLNWQPVPGVQTTWCGVPSDLGHIDIWLRLPVGAPPAGPFRMLAKFPRSDPPGPAVPVLLGLEFLLAHRAAAALLTPPQPSSLMLP